MPLYRCRAGRGGRPWAISTLPSAPYWSVARPERRRASAAGGALSPGVSTRKAGLGWAPTAHDERRAMLNKRILVVPAIVGLLVLGGAGLGSASTKAPTYKVCVKEGLVHGAKADGACPAGTRAVLVGSAGPWGLGDLRERLLRLASRGRRVGPVMQATSIPSPPVSGQRGSWAGARCPGQPPGRTASHRT